MTTYRLFSTPLFALAITSFAAGCADEKVDKPSDEDYADIAQGVAPLIRQELGANGGLILSTQVAAGDAPAWLSVEVGGNTHQGRVGSLQWKVSASCTDDSGNANGACDERTRAAEVTSSVQGNLMLPHYSAALEADATCSISGLGSDTIVAKGTKNLHAMTSFTGLLRPVTRSFELDFSANYDVSMPVNAPQLASGILEATIDADRVVSGTDHDREAHFKVDATVMLNGDGTATVSLDGAADFQLNLDSGQIVRVEASAGG